MGKQLILFTEFVSQKSILKKLAVSEEVELSSEMKRRLIDDCVSGAKDDYPLVTHHRHDNCNENKHSPDSFYIFKIQRARIKVKLSNTFVPAPKT
ncbi:hypothetical protein PR048_033019 [Dryococelus australis]|uniref:Uncharacterized protein n=1 Tax=Dryococelus australis TaxID=614101 RepID=A0ABQ9G3W8_9NEOP|nr:hypothetical protein PR048_033019 [Dryococelus australis]